MNAIDKARIEMIENSIVEDAEIGRMYSDDLLFHVYEAAGDAIKDALKDKNPDLWDLVDDTMMLGVTINAKNHGSLTDREAQNLLTMIPEISHLTEVIKAK